jgi:3-oxoacyl-[acyl-carrier protein] reductase
MSILPDLNGRVALVTGGGRGIGRGISLALAEAGAVVAVNYRERSADAQATVEQITAAGGRAVALQADVSENVAVTRLVAETEGSLGVVDILVNNAGVSRPLEIEEIDEAAFIGALRTNLVSAFLCTQAVLPGMRQRRWGRVVNITSGAAHTGGVVGVHYTASKSGMEGLTKGYAKRVAQDGVTVNSVAPSLVETEMTAPHRKANVHLIPVGRLGTVAECAQAVLLCVGAGYINGTTVHVNGGLYFN